MTRHTTTSKWPLPQAQRVVALGAGVGGPEAKRGGQPRGDLDVPVFAGEAQRLVVAGAGVGGPEAEGGGQPLRE